LGHLDQSQVILEGMLTHALRMRYLALMAFGFSLLGAIVLARHDYPWAARLFGAALALREKTGIPIPAIEQGQYEHWVSRTQDALGGANFYSAWIEGYHLSPEQVLSNQSVSQRLLSDHAQPTGPEQLLTDLTQREIEVFRLLTEGLSNAEIARRLMLATVTISSYLRSIYTKLGVTSRTQAMRYAIDHQVFQHNQKEV
jgi:DNA-binding CsgD family transcriptional regulator